MMDELTESEDEDVFDEDDDFFDEDGDEKGGPGSRVGMSEKSGLLTGRGMDSKIPGFYSIHQKGSGIFGSVLNVVTTVVGAGILGMPYAVAQAGWAGLALFCLAALMALYTGKKLIRCMYASRPLPKLGTFAAVGRKAFGPIGDHVTMACQYITLVFAGALYLVLCGISSESLAKSIFSFTILTQDHYVLIAAVLLLPVIISFKRMKELVFLSFFGAFSSAFVAVVVMVYALVFPLKPAPNRFLIVPTSLPFAFATFTFAFAGHPVFPTIQTSMKKTKSFSSMLDWAYLFIMVIYLSVSITSYWGFGSETQSPVTLNLLGSGNGYGDITGYLATGAITLHVWFAISIINNPVNLWLEEEIICVEKRKGPELIWRAFLRTALLGVQILLGMGLPMFDLLMGFIGGTTVAATVFFLPCLFYLKLFWRRLHWSTILWVCLILETATLGSTIGIYSTVVEFLDRLLGWNVKVEANTTFFMILCAASLLGFVFIAISLFLISRHYSKRRSIQ